MDVIEYGAVGDGIADDTSALSAALASGDMLDWGGADRTYRVTAELAVTLAAPLRWVSTGARITCDAASPVRNVVKIEPNGHPVTIAGPFTIDAARNAFTGLYILSADSSVDVRIADLHSVGAYRSSLAHAGGDGMHLRGAFGSVTLERPVVQDVAMDPAAWVQGSQGITGITVSALDADRYPRRVSVIDPLVENVLSEDTTSSADQDGIRIMTANFGPESTTPYDTVFRIEGGVIRNTGGRAVKSQVQWGSVRGLHVHRDVDRQPAFREVDFQKGGGHVSDLTVRYDGTGCASVVCFGDGANPNVTVPQGTVDGIKVLLSGGAEVDQVVTVRDMDNAGMRVMCRGMEVSGGTVSHLLRVEATSGAQPTTSASDAIADITESAVLAYYGAPDGWGGNLSLHNIVNVGATVPALTVNETGMAHPDIHTSGLVRVTAGGGGGEGTAERLDLSPIIDGWDEVDATECAATYADGAVTYTFKVNSPTAGDSFPMLRLPVGWRPSSAGIAELRAFDNAETMGSIFVALDGRVTAYRASSSSSWLYGTVTLPA